MDQKKCGYREHKFLWVQIRGSMGTDQRKHGYRSENIGNRGYRSEKAWVQIRECRLLWVQIREHVGTDQGLGTD